MSNQPDNPQLDTFTDYTKTGVDEAPANNPDLEKLAMAFSNCFNTVSGKRVMEHLFDIFVMAPTFVPGNGFSNAENGFLREGEKNAYKYINNMIKKGDSIV